MKKIRKVCQRFLCIFCASMMLTSIVTPAVFAEESLSEIEAEIKRKEDEIKEANAEKKEIMKGLNDVKEVVNGLKSDKKNLEKYVSELDGTLTEVEERISELKELIAEKEKEILETTKELEAAEKKEKEQYEVMKKRVQFLYEKGEGYYLELVFSAGSFGEFLNKKEYVEKVSDYDRKTFEKYVASRKLIEVCKKNLETDEEVLKEAKAKVDEEQKNLEVVISAKEEEINKKAGDIKDQQKALAEYEASIAVQNDLIKTLEKALQEQRKKLIEEGGEDLAYDGGMFKWPCPNYTRISDDYGMRWHPILQREKFHNGIDLAAPSGSPILAAYDGEVIDAGYNGSMGNYVMINHGGSLITIYMHARSLDVKKGDVVVKGQKIAGVGTTGRSTGNHLHFGVRLDGKYVSPWNYLSK